MENRWKYGLAGLAGLAVLTSCSGEPNPTVLPTPIVEPPQKYPEIGLYYPGLTNFAVRETGQAVTERSLTKWFNLSSATFDSNLAGQAIDYFEKLASSRKNLLYEFSGHAIRLLPELKPKTNRVIFLVPPQAPIPDWGQDISWTASTTRLFTDPYVSFVRTYNMQQDTPQSRVFTTAEKAINKALAVEICQSTISVRSVTVEAANLLQEIFCNSWGAAFALRQDGFNYDQYLQWASETLIRANPQSPSFPILTLTKTDYQNIPQIGLVIKN